MCTLPGMKRLVGASIVAVGSVCALVGVASAAAPGASSIPAGNPQHFISYDVTPRTPVETIDSFHYTVAVDTPLASDYVYYAQYQLFEKGGAGYYSGIQPHPDGTAGVRFSLFGAGGVALSPECRSGADGGNGVTCAIDVPYSRGTAYSFDITKAGSSSTATTWSGTITNDSTGVVTKMGSWSTPAAFGGLKSTTIGFIEKFSGIKTCADIPDVSVKYSKVSFGNDNPSSGAKIWPSSNGGSGIYTCLGVTPAKSASTVGQFNIASGDSTVSPVSPTTPVSPEPDPSTSILDQLGEIFGS